MKASHLPSRFLCKNVQVKQQHDANFIPDSLQRIKTILDNLYGKTNLPY